VNEEVSNFKSLRKGTRAHNASMERVSLDSEIKRAILPAQYLKQNQEPKHKRRQSALKIKNPTKTLDLKSDLFVQKTSNKSITQSSPKLRQNKVIPQPATDTQISTLLPYYQEKIRILEAENQELSSKNERLIHQLETANSLLTICANESKLVKPKSSLAQGESRAETLHDESSGLQIQLAFMEDLCQHLAEQLENQEEIMSYTLN